MISNGENKLIIDHFELTYIEINHNYEQLKKIYKELNEKYYELKKEVNEIDKLKVELSEKNIRINRMEKDQELKERELKRKIEESFSLDKSDSNSILSSNINDKLISETLKSSYSQLNEHFICKKCKTVPVIKFITLKNLKYACNCLKECRELETIMKENVQENILKDEDQKIEKDVYFEDYLKCPEHKQNYIYYCKVDKQNLCRQCIWEKSFHQDHTLFFFDLHYFEIYDKKRQIDNILNGKKQDQEDNFNLNNDPIEYILHLLSVIFNDFREYPNYAHIEIFRNAIKYFFDFINNKNNNQIIEQHNLTKEIKIMFKNDLLLDNNLNPEIIREIEINRSFLNDNDINKICELNLINLVKLTLHEDCIQSIEPFINAKFKDLEIFDLAQNKIRNDSIPLLSKLKFKKLKELNLYFNDITDSNIFRFNNNKCLPNLEIFYIGSNIIDWDLNNDKDKKIKYDLSTLKAIGLTNGIFNKKTVILYIKRFILTNLEILFINRNDFKTLDFINFLDLPKLKRIHMHSSLIEDYFPLIKYKTLEKIELRENCIKNIDNLKDFCEHFGNLTELNLKSNKFAINDKNKNIIESIEKKKKLNIII